MTRTAPGFTRIELLIAIGILLVLVAVLLRPILDSQRLPNSVADANQLRTHHQWLELYRMKHGSQLPSAGGCRFVLATWTSGVVPHTAENFDKYFSPGARDSDGDYQRKRKLIAQGEDPWPALNDVTSVDTHYAGRAQEHLATALKGNDEALMATDNEDWWTLRDGTINILFANGDVRSLSWHVLQKQFGLGPFDPEEPIQTWGPKSPIPECRKLAND